jgi:hypothetical protein
VPLLTGNEIFGKPVVESAFALREHGLKPEVLYGVAGEFVRTILPHTEADSVALLMNLLTGFGSIIGRNSFYMVEGARHYPNLFFVQVGETSKGRKGTSWNRVKQALEMIDPGWGGTRIQGGLSSGEGLITAVASTDGNRVDPRLLIVASEFASTLAVMGRLGNTLSSVIREAWDSSPLQIMVRNNPLRAEGAHISIIGHITKEELRRHLDSTESANGFANRFIWIRSERSKCLPNGGGLQDSDIEYLAQSLAPAVEFAKQPRQLRRDPDAERLWEKIYEPLSAGRPGLIGAVTGRAEAQVLRLSCLYALLDCSAAIRVPHIEAALAIWDYASESAEWIFGDAIGDSVADSILSALRSNPDGMSRTAISALFARNRSASRIGTALQSLASRGLAVPTPQSTDGRTAEVWKVVRPITK